MPTCPNCGEIVMEGDPYCSNCGTTFRWVDEEYEMKRERKSSRPVSKSFHNVHVSRFYDVILKLEEEQYITEGIMRSFDLKNAKNTFFNLNQDFTGSDINISFERMNKYFTTVDYVTYSYINNEIESYGFKSYFYNLENADWFKRAVRQKEIETGLQYLGCGGGYDAKHHWSNTNVLELKDKCNVVAHFVKDE